MNTEERKFIYRVIAIIIGFFIGIMIGNIIFPPKKPINNSKDIIESFNDLIKSVPENSTIDIKTTDSTYVYTIEVKR